jgi:glycosyltransferase involved in cell wall biosynthesis
MLNIAFLDMIGWDYDVSTPYRQPLGGSQSALAYLAAELARRGARVTLFCRTSAPGEVLGVSCVSIQTIAMEWFAQPFDALIVLNGPADACAQLRPHLADATPLVLWTQHAADQPAMQPLRQPGVRAGWDAVVCVSDWHRTTMIAAYGLEPGRVVVLRNAIGPWFEGLFSSGDALVLAKGAGPGPGPGPGPILGYTSTPFRGLNVLLSVFPEVRAEFPSAELAVYSSMKVYQQDEPGDAFASLYQWCRAAPGVRYVGSLAQPRLAEELKGVAILAYPNTFAETSCIAVMEALAAGLFVVTADLGALPETTRGFAALVPPPAGPEDLRPFAERFRDRLRGVLRDHAADPGRFAAARMAQVAAVNAGCTWSQRAAQWEEAVRGWSRIRCLPGRP